MNSPHHVCDVCKAPMSEELSDFTVEREGQSLLLEDVPVWICPQCDNMLVDDEIIEAVEDMLYHLDQVAVEDDEE